MYSNNHVYVLELTSHAFEGGQYAHESYFTQLNQYICGSAGLKSHSVSHFSVLS